MLDKEIKLETFIFVSLNINKETLLILRCDEYL